MRAPSAGAVMAGLAALHVAGFAATVWLTMIRQPFWDMLAWLDAYMRFRADGGLLDYALALHNEHRLAWIRLLTAIDAEAFGSSGLPFIAASTAALVIAAAMLMREAARIVSRHGPAAPLLWLVPMLCLTTANAIDCSIPINSVYPLALVFVVGAAVLFDGAADATPWRPGAAVALAAGAGLANAVGLVAWPMLLWLGWRGRVGWRWLLIVGIAAFAYVVLYVRSLTPVAIAEDATAQSSLAPGHLAKMAGYLLAYLGLPLSRLNSFPLPGRMLGGGVLVAGVASLIRYGFVVPRPTRAQRIATGLILFSLGGAVLAAVGRTDLAAAINVPVRYTVLVTPLHAGLLLLALPRIAVAAGRKRGLVVSVGAFCGVALLVQQAIGGVSAIAVAGRMREVVARYYAGARDADMASVVYPDLAVADGIVAALRRQGLYTD